MCLQWRIRSSQAQTRRLALQMNNSALDGLGYGLGTIVSVELSKNTLDVILRRILHNPQFPGDLLVAQALSEQPEHLDFAAAQIRSGDLGR